MLSQKGGSNRARALGEEDAESLGKVGSILGSTMRAGEKMETLGW
jgi:hypothetical protein